MKIIKTFIILFIIVFLIDIAIGFSLSYLADSLSHENAFMHFLDEIISFPLSLWNRLFPEHGFYRSSTNSFWTIIIVNALMQAFILLVIRLLYKSLKTAFNK